MKLIFLDIDGVLAPLTLRGLSSHALDLFASIVKQTDADVVLSSQWRLPACRDQLKRLEQELRKWGVTFFGATPNLGTTRGEEIACWLITRPDAWTESEPSFVILDDDPNDEMGELKPHLVKCDGYQGLTQDIAAEVIRRLNHP